MIPLELVIKIIAFLDDRPFLPGEWEYGSHNDEIWEHTTPALASCSLDSDVPFHAFAFLHFTAPHLCEYVRELRLDFSDSVTDSLPEWMHACLCRFKNVRELEVCNWSDTHEAITTPLARGLASLLSATNLKRLALSFWEEVEDTSDLLLILSACSTTLEDLSIDFPLEALVTAPLVIHLEALRKLEVDSCPLPFARTDILVCPNLETFTYTLDDDDSFELPSWIPASIHELILRATPTSRLPQFEQSIHPFRLTLQVDTLESSNLGIRWVSECIKHLPFLGHVQQLIVMIGISTGDFLPYDSLCSLLRPLQMQYPALSKQIVLNITASEEAEADVLDDIRVGETERMKKVFAPFLEAGSFSAQLVIKYELKVIVQCGVTGMTTM
ncbi:hypothetical protein EYR36_002393 [Pleurotus pulmonarius]|nr:hypothetical protein EYR36_002393 [Pleurotus pulmonarius]